MELACDMQGENQLLKLISKRFAIFTMGIFAFMPRTHANMVYTGIQYKELGTHQHKLCDWGHLPSNIATITEQASPEYDFQVTQPIHGITSATRIQFEANLPANDHIQAWLQLPAGETFDIGHYKVTNTHFLEKTDRSFNIRVDGVTYSQVKGYFDILEIEFDATGEVTTLAANFALSAEPSGIDCTIDAAVRYHSQYDYDHGFENISPGTSVPEPAALSMITVGILLLTQRPVRRT